MEVSSLKYYSIKEFSKIINRTAQTLRNWDKSGRLKPNHTGENGYRYYSQSQLNEVLGKEQVKQKKILKQLKEDDTDD